MVRLILGEKGTGKTKRLIALVKEVAAQEPGNVVCIAANSSMTYDIPYQIRLVNGEEYPLDSYESLRGFICGLYAGNYDISYIFIDGLYKIVKNDDMKTAAAFLGWVSKFSEAHQVNFAVTLAENPDNAIAELQQYM